jgi:hypothetical protein
MTLAKDSCFSISGTLDHELGFQFFNDSVTSVHPDETSLSLKLSLKLFKRTDLALHLMVTTQLMKGHEIVADEQGNPIRVATSSFLTPVVFSGSLGISNNWPGLGDLNLGIAGAKLTWLRDRQVFERLKQDVLYGVSREKGFRLEYGLTLRLLVDKDLFKKVHWHIDLLVFQGYQDPPDFSLKNLLSFRLNRFIKTSLQTKISYEEKLSKNIQIENHLNIGLAIQL